MGAIFKLSIEDSSAGPLVGFVRVVVIIVTRSVDNADEAAAVDIADKDNNEDGVCESECVNNGDGDVISLITILDSPSVLVTL